MWPYIHQIWRAQVCALQDRRAEDLRAEDPSFHLASPLLPEREDPEK